MDKTLEQARTFFLEGVAHYEAGRLEQAERQFAAALSLAPGRPSVLTNLGAVRLRLQRAAEALPVLEEALAQEPDNPEALAHAATALAELGRTPDALPLFDRAIAAGPQPATVWMFRGSVLRELGRAQEAAASYREALARGGDAELLNYYLAGLEGGAAPPRPPRHYVQGLFDSYADGFDTHLKTLRYDAPGVLVQRLAASGRRFAHALDLGCGTGLCGRLLRPLATRLTGVDLSPQMLARSRALGVYDDLQQADVVEYLAAQAGPFDAVVAADVFIYVGVLDEVFRLLAARMPPGGLFAFTVEESTGAEVVLRGSLRYAHSEAGLQRLAREHGFRIQALERRPVREDQRQPIAGLFAWMERL
ncbi:tetratricopeptide repeat protein [Ramlibacter sp. USB13]|uniref:Tetratricopeptide repeat protein n=1 Tax=Ramlibacter cellulosilyticus TaxID=2764187 RepID=A0A923MTP8_9BURK|nr:tetratricopeptide repeat protein [Ramlibacter cellulosilyticus]MBC5783994.1 tetratricopeptide repeat protein [Ramlibacter cellulosilyticus]